MKAVLDTNVIIYSFLSRVDLMSELERNDVVEVLIPSSVLEELERLSDKGGKEGRAARVALEYLSGLISKGKVKVVETAEKGDSALLEVAEKFGCAVITNDLELRRRAKRRGLATGCFRGKSRIAITPS